MEYECWIRRDKRALTFSIRVKWMSQLNFKRLVIPQTQSMSFPSLYFLRTIIAGRFEDALIINGSHALPLVPFRTMCYRNASKYSALLELCSDLTIHSRLEIPTMRRKIARNAQGPRHAMRGCVNNGSKCAAVDVLHNIIAAFSS